MTRTLYVLYNANGTAFGKLSYGYKKLTSASDKPICAACEITHGGLRLDENEGWKAAKAQIQKEGDMEVKQLHRDELGADVSPDSSHSVGAGRAIWLKCLLYATESDNLTRSRNLWSNLENPIL